MSVQVVRAGSVTEELLLAVQRLVPQLNPGAPPPTRERVEALVAGDCTTLWIARDDQASPAVVGMLTVAHYPLPTGPRVWIEDVVVDAGSRGRGVGEALVRTGLRQARELGAARVDLTSRPEREAANRLYRRLGFQLRETNAYRYVFGE